MIRSTEFLWGMMKKGVAIVLLLAGGLSASGQVGFIAHLDSVQTGRNGCGSSIREVEDGYLLFTTQRVHPLLNRDYVHIRKLDSQGRVTADFKHREGDMRDLYLGYLDPVSDVVSGTTMAAISEGGSYSRETWLYRFGIDGDTLERRLLVRFQESDSILHGFRQMRSTSDGGAVICGTVSRPGPTAYAWIVRLDEQGDTAWTSVLGQQDQAYDPLGIEEYVDGGFVMTGTRAAGFHHNTSFLIRTDATGAQLWRRYYGAFGYQDGAVRVAVDGNIITWSAYRQSGWEADHQQMMLTKWSPDASILWQRKLHKNYQVGTTDMEVLPDGSILGAAIIWNRAALVKFSSDGDSLWTREYTLFSGYHRFYDVQTTGDGGFICTGVASSYPPLDTGIQTRQVIWVVKTDSLGCVVPGCHTVGVQEYLMDLNEHLSVWPNPVAAGTPLTVAFDPPHEFTRNGPLRVVVLDALGKQVHAERVQVGTSLLANLPLATGVYHLHLTDNTRWLAGANFVVE